MNRTDALRLGLMGLGKPESKRNARQRRLRTIIMGTPILRQFKPEQYGLWKKQQLYFDKRMYFVTSRSYDELITLAGELVDLDDELSAAQDLEYLEAAEP